MDLNYFDFFRRVTNHDPFPYQVTLAHPPFQNTILSIPTGLGKTDAALIPWLYARVTNPSSAPTRYIAVLPRQNLTSQTAAIARERVARIPSLADLPVLELMGGRKEDNDAKLAPHQPAIIVATQDIYFSRALNRGYARRPSHWPIDFALYNQDALIVLDEVQLMDDALATSTQLAAFRAQFNIHRSAPTIWMSATLNSAWLRTVDASNVMDAARVIQLSAADISNAIVAKRFNAAKSLQAAPDSCRTPAGCADFALDNHQSGTRTLIICNTVPRAREIANAIRKRDAACHPLLLHSRFRPQDRARLAQSLTAECPAEGQIVVATQVLEAGIDISSRLLITDIAPWSSLVQRFGRVNRTGDDAGAQIYWVDQPSSSRKKDPSFLPYSQAEIDRALKVLAKHPNSASPAHLAPEQGPPPWQHVIRRADLLDLYDTTPDLAGNDLDVSRFIRATDDKDVFVAWRNEIPSDAPEAADIELCPVPIGQFREFAEKQREARCWDFASGTWQPIDRNRLFPGMIALVPSACGGYTPELGWAPDSNLSVPPVNLEQPLPADSSTADLPSSTTYRQSLRGHTRRVAEEMEKILAHFNLSPAESHALRRAALLHDWGKLHPEFQKTLNGSASEPFAKQCGNARHQRPHLRHELASALAMMQTGESKLAAFITAAHHGKVRLSIRAMPGERPPESLKLLARGIVDGESLPAHLLDANLSLPAIPLSLAPMQLGGSGTSWSQLALDLLHEHGPFKLALLETLLRCADTAASASPNLEDPDYA